MSYLRQDQSQNPDGRHLSPSPRLVEDKSCSDRTKQRRLTGGVLTSLVVLSLTLSIYKIMPGPMVDLAEKLRNTWDSFTPLNTVCLFVSFIICCTQTHFWPVLWIFFRLRSSGEGLQSGIALVGLVARLHSATRWCSGSIFFFYFGCLVNLVRTFGLIPLRC